MLTRRDQERLPINLYGGKVDVYRPAPLDADQPLEWLLTRNHVRDFRVQYLERHHGVAQLQAVDFFQREGEHAAVADEQVAIGAQRGAARERSGRGGGGEELAAGERLVHGLNLRKATNLLLRVVRWSGVPGATLGLDQPLVNSGRSMNA